MASVIASSQLQQHHRCCVFVGNIPYDATEEQVVEICGEVGHVVSFRLVVDRESGKHKGYGFCEYKDEETALSARRNLQGYQIHGRPLRVDSASKADHHNHHHHRDNRVDQKGVVGGPGLHQPMGIPCASAAASVMARVLSLGVGHQKSGTGNDDDDPLTHYLSRFSRQQLKEIMCEMKALLNSQNKPSLAEQMLLLQGGQLTKALFQAQIMLGLVSPQQLMQMTESRRHDQLFSSSTIMSVPIDDQHPSKRRRLEEDGINANAPPAPAPAPQQMEVATTKYSAATSCSTLVADSLVQISKPSDQCQMMSEVEYSSLVQQVMRLTPEQVTCLPPDQRQQLLQLQQQIMMIH